jgi:PEP-CTERM motif
MLGDGVRAAYAGPFDKGKYAMRLSMSLGGGLLALSLLVAAAGSARAESITFTLDAPLTAKPPGSGAPTITFDDLGGTGTVVMTMSLEGLTDPDEFVTSWFFNSDVNPTGFTFTFDDANSTGAAAASIDSAFNSAADFKADGTGGLHDILFQFSSSNGQGGALRFGAGEVVVYTITGAGITASTFDVLSISDAGNPQYHSVVHLQGIAQDPPGSTYLGDFSHSPEPGTIALVAVGVAGLVARRRRRARG